MSEDPYEDDPAAGLTLTPTQQRFLDVLGDGLPHSRDQLRNCLPDPLGDYSNVQLHISYLRKKLRPRGQDILCVFHQKSFYYRWVRLLRMD